MTAKTKTLAILSAGTFLSSTLFFPVYADDGNTVLIGSWSSLQQHARDYGKTFRLSDSSFNLDGSAFDIGSAADVSGDWKLDGNNIRLTGNYQNRALAVMKNINSFAFNNMNVENFKKENGWGGFLYNDNAADAAQAEITDSVFTRNGASLGGVIYNNGIITTINNVEFNDNFVDNGAGGAIYNNGSIQNISDSSFTQNNAYSKDGGGAVYNNSNATIALIKNTNFENNKASGQNGGAIYNAGTITAIEGGSFTGNGYDGNDAGNAGQYVSVGGAVYNHDNATIISVNSSFTDNRAQYGGAAIFNNGEIDTVSGKFENNYAGSEGGGAIKNKNHIKSIENAEFVANRSDNLMVPSTLDGKGGAVYNFEADAEIETIKNSHFYGNSSNDFGGAISNSGKIGLIDGSFFGKDGGGNSGASGGAINNQSGGQIGTISNSVFAYNEATEPSDYSQGLGGAVRNAEGAVIETIKNSVFSNNTANGLKEEYRGDSTDVMGGAVYNKEAYIKTISGSKFSGNIAGVELDKLNGHTINAYGGAVYSRSDGSGYETLGAVTDTEFSGNAAMGTYAYGGAVYTYSNNNTITGNFIRNYAQGSNRAAGGALYMVYGNSIVRGDFIGNYAQSTNGRADGGAIAAYGNTLSLNSGADTHFMSGNYTLDSRGKIYNAVSYPSYQGRDPEITFNTSGGGSWVINDNINMEASGYPIRNLNFIGDDTVDTDTGTTTQYISVNNDILYALNTSVEGTTLRFGSYRHDDETALNWNGKGGFAALQNDDGTTDYNAEAITGLSLNNAVFDIANGYLETVKLKNYSATDSFVHLDVDTDNLTSDVINVAGDVDGITKLIVHSSSDADIRGKGSILFAESVNDTKGNAGSFVVSRVYKSPYLFDVKYETATGENDNAAENKWFFAMNDTENPDKDIEPIKPEDPKIPDYKPDYTSPSVAPEVIAGEGLHEAAIEQTRSLVRNVRNKVAAGREYCPNCGVYSAEWDGKQLRNVWVLAQGETATIDKPVKADADIWGVEAGFDVQNDIHNTLGVFASYRKGEYDLSGKADKLRSNVGSEIDIDSYLAGLYYRYDKNMNWLFATVYGGVQQADAKTDDKITKLDTDGIEFGAGIEAGHSYELSDNLILEPSLGLYYTQINFDDAKDNVGKEYDWKDIKHLEAELGAKLEKQIDYAKIYVKPSVIQTITSGDSVKITGLNKLSTYDDATLGRIELGGRYGFTDALSAYGWVNYTFGADYDATAFGAGLNYSW